jgi:hypothetical protein
MKGPEKSNNSSCCNIYWSRKNVKSIFLLA